MSQHRHVQVSFSTVTSYLISSCAVVACMPLAVPSRAWELDSFARCLCLRDLASLSCARKEWQYSILLLYNRPHARQLVQAFESCIPGLETELARRHLTEKPENSEAGLHHLWTLVSFLQAAVSAPWGPALAAAPGLLEDLTQLFTVPQLPFRVLKYVATHLNVRIGTQQLLAAAWQRVTGVESWMQFQCLHHQQSGLPDAVEEICCRSNKLHLAQLHSQTSKDVVDYLQLAFNCRDHTIASHVAVELLSHITDTAVLLDLLQTVVLRHHSDVLQMVLTIPAAKQLSPAAVLQLMQSALEQSSHDTSWGPAIFEFSDSAAPLVHWLVQLPAAADLTSGQLLRMLQTASDKHRHASVAILCSLPAANDIPACDLVNFLKPAVARWSNTDVPALCSLSGAAALTINDLLPLFEIAASNRELCHIRTLCRLPAAQQMPLDVLTSLLKQAVEYCCNSEPVVWLCSLPAAADLSSEAWMSITQVALRHLSKTGLIALCKLPAATCAAPEVFAALLQAAIGSGRLSAVEVVCQSPAAKSISSEHILQLMRHLVSDLGIVVAESCQHEYYEAGYIKDVLQAMTALEVVQDLPAAELIELFKIWNDYSFREGPPLRIWFKCHALHSMSRETLVQHMQEAINQQDHVLLRILCQLPVARRLDTDTLMQLFSTTLAVDGSGGVAMQKCLACCCIDSSRKQR